MDKIERVTILAVGDRPDYDAYKKFHREKKVFPKYDFDYVHTDYIRFLKGKAPEIKTKKLIVFFFFPFMYWNKYIEHKGYKGVYGNQMFFNKFLHFCKRIYSIVKKSYRGKEIFFVNHPTSGALCRDKKRIVEKLSQNGIQNPKTYRVSGVEGVERLLKRGHDLFIKPRYGSMGKGISFLNHSSWQTNFSFKNGRIISRRSDHGWKFREITGNSKFLSSLLRNDFVVEKAVDTMVVKKKKIELRVYTFFNKVLYVYPRKNSVSKITTNISQGAKGDPGLLRILPKHLVSKAEKAALEAAKALGLNFAGIDILTDKSLKNAYVIDINAFPGFPKRRTFNLSQAMIKELAGMRNRKELIWGQAKELRSG